LTILAVGGIHFLSSVWWVASAESLGIREQLVVNWLYLPYNPVMTVTVGAFEAKTHLSELLARVEGGEEVTITKHGRPVARLVPVSETPLSRDWSAFWAKVDTRLVTLTPGTSIRADIEAGRK
jgi:prevent-host-death family protein